MIWRCTHWFLSLLLFAPAAFSASSSASSDSPTDLNSAVQIQCLPGQDAFLRARLNGSINSELSWDSTNLSCAGSVRPNNDGLRMRFSTLDKNDESKLVLLFGITGLKEGADGNALPANLTIMVEGKGEFYATQGDNKCTIDEVHQVPLQGIPLRQRAYRVTARGFCTQPARALNGDGAVLVSRFDFTGRADFSSDEATADQSAKP